MIVYIDMDDVLCQFEFEKQQQILQNPEIEFPQSQLGFFENLKPIDGAIESVKELITSDLFEPYILTAPSILNPHCYTEKRLWVEKHLGIEFVDKLIICCNKGLLKGDVLIDDYIEGRGQKNFEGELIHFGSNRFSTWEKVMVFLKNKVTAIEEKKLISKTLFNALSALNISSSDAAKIFKVTESEFRKFQTIGISPNSIEADLVYYIVKLFRLINSALDGNDEMIAQYVHHEVVKLRATPLEIMIDPERRDQLVNYLLKVQQQ